MRKFILMLLLAAISVGMVNAQDSIKQVEKVVVKKETVVDIAQFKEQKKAALKNAVQDLVTARKSDSL